MSDYTPLPIDNVQKSAPLLEVSEQNLNNKRKPLVVYLNNIIQTVLNPTYFLFFIVIIFFIHLLVLYILKKTVSVSFGITNIILLVIIILVFTISFYESRGDLKTFNESAEFFSALPSVLCISILLSFLTNYLDTDSSDLIDSNIDTSNSFDTSISYEKS